MLGSQIKSIRDHEGIAFAANRAMTLANEMDFESKKDFDYKLVKLMMTVGISLPNA